jgi:hypothetical protein
VHTVKRQLTSWFDLHSLAFRCLPCVPVRYSYATTQCRVSTASSGSTALRQPVCFVPSASASTLYVCTVLISNVQDGSCHPWIYGAGQDLLSFVMFDVPTVCSKPPKLFEHGSDTKHHGHKQTSLINLYQFKHSLLCMSTPSHLFAPVLFSAVCLLCDTGPRAAALQGGASGYS